MTFEPIEHKPDDYSGSGEGGAAARPPLSAADEARAYLSTPPTTPAWFSRTLVTQLLVEHDAAVKRAETAKRELAELRERIGEATVQWAVYWRSVRDHYEICETEEEAREAFDPDDPTYEVRSRVVGEWKAADGGAEVPAKLQCGCLGFCEGGPECLDDEGGPWPQEADDAS